MNKISTRLMKKQSEVNLSDFVGKRIKEDFIWDNVAVYAGTEIKKLKQSNGTDIGMDITFNVVNAEVTFYDVPLYIEDNHLVLVGNTPYSSSDIIYI